MPTARTANPRPVTRTAELIRRTAYNLAKQVRLLLEYADRLDESDARTGRPDPSVRASRAKAKRQARGMKPKAKEIEDVEGLGSGRKPHRKVKR